MGAWRILILTVAVLACVEANRPQPRTPAKAAEAGASKKAFYIYGYGSLLHEGSRIRVGSCI
jgi:hypothetical protein